jgi:hypothetical protein
MHGKKILKPAMRVPVASRHAGVSGISPDLPRSDLAAILAQL